MNENQSATKYEGPMAPIVLSIIGVVVWLVFILLYALYWSNGFSLFQNVIVTIVSLAIAALLIGLMWLPWFHLSGEPRRQQSGQPS